LPLVKSPSGLTLLTIHDIGPIQEDRGKLNRFIYTKTFEHSLSLADHIITVSETIKNEILEIYPNNSISVIYNGIDIESYKNTTDEEAVTVSQKYGLPAEFLLAVGHFRKRKNYIGLVEAAARLHERGRMVQLVFVGNESGELPLIKQRIDELGLSDHIAIYSNLTDLEVRCMYRLCKLFVFPSAYEGFGIPILEAMAAERPMVISDISVFQEITQGKGAYFDHSDPDSIADAVEGVLSSTVERERLVRYGDERVRDFGFANLAINLESLYRSLR
jgi:glycosyltransferase involved in cell wall biosynthesis